jgi:hypothetical protein
VGFDVEDGGDGRPKLRHGVWRAPESEGHSSLAVDTTFCSGRVAWKAMVRNSATYRTQKKGGMEQERKWDY